jgi:putative transposase
MLAVEQVGPTADTAVMCRSLGLPRATLYRRRQAVRPKGERAARVKPPRALLPEERSEVLEILHSERFADQSPSEVQATLLEEGRYLCSERTMYRILTESDEVRERRNQLRHPQYTKPELMATRPNQVWSWDITKLKGPAKWTYFYLYVLLDIFSRYVVGWMVAESESAELSRRLIEESCLKQGIPEGQLTIHADRGSPMVSKTLALLLVDLGIEKTHSRPRVSNDNPYSEAQFKTLKYRPGFPERFGSVQHARDVCRELLTWYNEEHHHSGLSLLTPLVVHHGRVDEVFDARHRARLAAYAERPERFVNGPPRRECLARAVWINRPEKTTHQDAPDSTQTTEVDLEVVPISPACGPNLDLAISSNEVPRAIEATQ